MGGGGPPPCRWREETPLSAPHCGLAATVLPDRYYSLLVIYSTSLSCQSSSGLYAYILVQGSNLNICYTPCQRGTVLLPAFTAVNITLFPAGTVLQLPGCDRYFSLLVMYNTPHERQVLLPPVVLYCSIYYSSPARHLLIVYAKPASSCAQRLIKLANCGGGGGLIPLSGLILTHLSWGRSYLTSSHECLSSWM